LAGGNRNHVSQQQWRARAQREGVDHGASYLREWQKFAAYRLFEQIALGTVLFLLCAITVYCTVVVVVRLIGDFILGVSFLDKVALQETFGSILTIVILLEFSHSIYVALTQKSGAIQVRIVVPITVLVIARKLMLQDFAAMNIYTLLGFGGATTDAWGTLLAYFQCRSTLPYAQGTG